METEEQRSLLLSIGEATHAQGYYYSKALSPEAADDMLRSGRIAEKAEYTDGSNDDDEDGGDDDGAGGDASAQPAETDV